MVPTASPPSFLRLGLRSTREAGHFLAAFEQEDADALGITEGRSFGHTLVIRDDLFATPDLEGST